MIKSMLVTQYVEAVFMGPPCYVLIRAHCFYIVLQYLNKEFSIGKVFVRFVPILVFVGNVLKGKFSVPNGCALSQIVKPAR